MNKKSATLLVIDDENTQLTEKLLVSEGYHILTAKNGLAGLKILEEQKVDLVLLDIVMPEMDGYEVLRQIRSQYEDRVSVLLASASYIDSVHVAHGLQIGADDYMIKPFDFFELKARIESKLYQHDLKNELRQARREAEAQSDYLRSILTIVQNATCSQEHDRGDNQTVAKTIYQGLKELLSIDQVTIWRFNGERLIALRDNPQPLPEEITMMIQGNQSMRREGERLLLPMRIKDKVEGLLDLEWVESGPSFAITILKALADSLAIVFQNSDYVQQIKRERLFHSLLNHLASEDATLEKMLAELADFTATRLLLVNRWFDLLVEEEQPQFVQGGHIQPFIIDYYRVQGIITQIEQSNSTISITNYGVIPAHHLIPVKLGGEVMAVIISLPRDGKLQSISEKELEGVARFLAGVLQRRREADLREQRYQADFLNEFLSGQLAKLPRSDVFLRANAQGLNLALPGLVARIELSSFDQKVDWSKPLFLQYVREQLTPLWRDAKAAREGLQLEGLEVIIGKNVLSILSLPLASTEKQARQKSYQWAEQVLNSYAHRHKQSTNKALIGLGRLVTDWQKWSRSANEAERALRWLLSNAQVSISYYGDLGSERLLAAVNDREELLRFYQEQIGPLITYDTERDGELRHTLEIFFANGGQLSRAAQQLYIHPNTLKYRLDQITNLTGRDPREPNIALDFQLALKIHNMF